jgi:hypothetical protein
MIRRTVQRVLLVAVLVATGIAWQGGQVAGGQTGPTGYTYAAELRGLPGAGCDFLAIDLPTGEAEVLSSDPQPCADGLTFGPDGTLYAFRQEPNAGGLLLNSELVIVDPTSGEQEFVGDLPGVGDGGMTFDAAGDLWLYASKNGESECPQNVFSTFCLWQVDPATGATQFVGAAPEGTGVLGLAGSCDDRVLGIDVTFASAGPSLASNTTLDLVDRSTAGLDTIVPLPTVFFPAGLDFDDVGSLWALGNAPQAGQSQVTTYLIDEATGDATATGVTVNGQPFIGVVSGLAVSPIGACPVPPPPPPEPAPEAVALQPTFTG